MKNTKIKWVLAISTFVYLSIIFSCSKNNASPSASNKKQLDITGTWYYLCLKDTLLNRDNSFYAATYSQRDTAVQGYKQCNYVIIQKNDTCIAGSCYFPGPSLINSYYKFISDSVIIEHSIQLISPFNGFEQDTAKILKITPNLLVLRRNGIDERFDSTGMYKYFIIHTIDSLYK